MSDVKMYDYAGENIRADVLPFATEGEPLCRTLEDRVAEAFSTIRQVRDVHIEREGGELLVSVIAHAPSRDIRYSIYDRQFALMEEFPEATFDFRLVQAA